MSEVDRTTPRRAWEDQVFGDDGSDRRADQLRCALIVIERNAFLRDCLVGGLSASAPAGIVGYASLSELDPVSFDRCPAVALLSVLSLSERETEGELALLAEISPRLPVMIFARSENPDEALAAFGRGAKGYMAMDAGFEILIQVLRFVAAGGAYVSAQCLVAVQQSTSAAPAPMSRHGMTSRELAVIEGIREGKPNKLIARKLNIREGTVKVHVRNIMKKIQARNRTDVAVKFAEFTPAPPTRRIARP